jgi:uncharacterized protein
MKSSQLQDMHLRHPAEPEQPAVVGKYWTERDANNPFQTETLSLSGDQITERGGHKAVPKPFPITELNGGYVPGKELTAALCLPNLRYPLIYLAGVVLAETVTTSMQPQVGLLLHGGLLIALLVQGSLFARRALQRFLIALSLAPLMRLLSLSLPLFDLPLVYWYAMVGMPLLLATWLAVHVLGYERLKIGLTCGTWRGFPLQLKIGISGLGFGYLQYLVLGPEALVDALVLREMLVPSLILLIFGGFLEELIFRGLLLRAAVETVGRFAILYVSLLYAAFHLGYHSVLNLILVFMIGVFFSYAALRTRSLLGVSMAHGLINLTMFLIYPFLV